MPFLDVNPKTIVVVDMGGTSRRIILSLKQKPVVWCNGRYGGRLWDCGLRGLIFLKIHEQLQIPVFSLRNDPTIRSSVEQVLLDYKNTLNSGDVQEHLALQVSQSRLSVSIDVTESEYKERCLPLLRMIPDMLSRVKGNFTCVLVDGGFNISDVRQSIGSEYRTYCESSESYLVVSVTDFVRRF